MPGAGAVHHINNDADLALIFAKELVGLRPDVILANGDRATAALQRETRTIPIVFAGARDPVGEGLVADLPRPGGNITGFGNQAEPGIVGKLVQMLKEIATGIRRVAIMYHPDMLPFQAAQSFLSRYEAAAQLLAVDLIIAPIHSDAEIETAIESLGREQGGLFAYADLFVNDHRAAVIAAATRNKVPTISYNPAFAREGGLMSYAPSFTDMFRGAAGYVDRILRGEKPADLPVQLPIKFEMAVNVKTATALGLTVPQSILLSADEVIE